MKATQVTGHPHHIVVLPGYARFEDYYVVLPKGGTMRRKIPQNKAKRKYGVYDIEYYIGDWGFIPARSSRLNHFIRVGRPMTPEASEYLQGYRTPQEYWGHKINPRKEAARISHQLCDMRGSEGHEARQRIRREILRR
jgi:hypothetical protein